MLLFNIFNKFKIEKLYFKSKLKNLKIFKVFPNQYIYIYSKQFFGLY